MRETVAEGGGKEYSRSWRIAARVGSGEKERHGEQRRNSSSTKSEQRIKFGELKKGAEEANGLLEKHEQQKEKGN